MVLDHRFKATGVIRDSLSALVYPLQVIVDLPSEISGWASNTFVTHTSTKDELESLRIKNQLLEAKLQTFASLKAENANLRLLLKSAERIEENVDKVLVGEILSADVDPFRRKVILNKGSQDGVYVDQPLIGAQGVMGKVVQVGPISSVALLITDASHALPVQVIGNGPRAIAVGKPKTNQLSLIHQPNNTDIKEGDVLVTSGFGCVFPQGYPAGKVTEININAKLPFAEIIVEPAARLDRDREVLLVWTGRRSRNLVEDRCATPKEQQP